MGHHHRRPLDRPAPFGRRLALGLILVLLTPGLAPAASEPEVIDRIVAVVNDDIITLTELNERLAPFAARIRSAGYPFEKERETIFKARQEILDQMIDETLTDQEVKRLGISVSSAEVDAAIERIKSAQAYTDEDLREALAQQGLTLEDYRNRIQEQLLRQQLVNRQVKAKIVITDEDIRRHYEKTRAEAETERRYHLQTILKQLPEAPSAAEMEEARQEMTAIRTRLEAGADFADVARDHSDALAEQGGDLGVFSPDNLAPEIRPTIEATAAGEITPVLETDLGLQIFHVVEVIRKSPAAEKPLSEVKDQIERSLYEQAVNEAFEDWLKTLRQSSHIRTIQ